MDEMIVALATLMAGVVVGLGIFWVRLRMSSGGLQARAELLMQDARA